MRFRMNGCYDAFLHWTLFLWLSDFNFRTSRGHSRPDNIFYVPFDGGGPINAIRMSRNPRKRIAPITTWITSVCTSIIFIVEYSSVARSRTRSCVESLDVITPPKYRPYCEGGQLCFLSEKHQILEGIRPYILKNHALLCKYFNELNKKYRLTPSYFQKRFCYCSVDLKYRKMAILLTDIRLKRFSNLTKIATIDDSLILFIM
jgi:hypothetical protein